MKKEITTKDIMALNELMTFENWIAVKMNMFYENETDKTLKTMFDEPISFYVRKSGTENIVRVIVQSNSEQNNLIAAQFIEEYLIKLSKGDSI